MIVDVEHATCILLPSEDPTVEPAPVTIDDDHLLTIKALRNGDASVLLASGASIDILPDSSDVLVQLGDCGNSQKITKSNPSSETFEAIRVQRDR